MHRYIAHTFFLKFGLNPHFYNPREGTVELDRKTLDINSSKTELGDFYNPIRLTVGWLNSAERGVDKYGQVFMNKVGGLFMNENVDILDEYQSEKLEWPGDNVCSTRHIEVRKWPDGNHYYLISRPDQVIFTREKLNTEAEAVKEAQRFALAANITTSGTGHTHRYTKVGD